MADPVDRGELDVGRPGGEGTDDAVEVLAIPVGEEDRAGLRRERTVKWLIEKANITNG